MDESPAQTRYISLANGSNCEGVLLTYTKNKRGPIVLLWGMPSTPDFNQNVNHSVTHACRTRCNSEVIGKPRKLNTCDSQFSGDTPAKYSGLRNWRMPSLNQGKLYKHSHQHQQPACTIMSTAHISNSGPLTSHAYRLPGDYVANDMVLKNIFQYIILLISIKMLWHNRHNKLVCVGWESPGEFFNRHSIGAYSYCFRCVCSIRSVWSWFTHI